MTEALTQCSECRSWLWPTIGTADRGLGVAALACHLAIAHPALLPGEAGGPEAALAELWAVTGQWRGLGIVPADLDALGAAFFALIVNRSLPTYVGRVAMLGGPARLVAVEVLLAAGREA